MSGRKNLIVEVTSLEPGKQTELIGELDRGLIEELFDSLQFLSDVQYKMILFKSKHELFVTGSVECEVESPCVRCLKPVQTEINGEIEATYIAKGEISDDETEQELESLENVIYYVGTEVDLFDRVVEAVVTGLPDRFLCAPDCKGLCPYCGADLNLEEDHQCSHRGGDAIDPRLAALKKLQLNNNSEKDDK